MKLFNKKIILQLLFLKLIISRPIDYKEENEESSIKPIKLSKLSYLHHQQHGGKDELTVFNRENKDPSHGIFNKFNFIHKYHKHAKKVNLKASLHVKQDSNKNDQPIQEYIPDHYIILFKKNVKDLSISQHIDKINTMVKISNTENDGSDSNEIKHIFNIDGFRGYHGKFDKATLKAIQESSEVYSIERDQKIRIKDLRVQINAPWNLSRISRRQLTENNINREKFVYQHSSGEGVTVYVIDTGINIHHVEFGGRASWGANYNEEFENEDFNGHGTHVAGVIGGTIYGVAKKANLVAVKVINKDGEGSLSSVIRGIEFSINDHLKRKSLNTTGKPIRSVINFSLGGPLSAILNRAVDTAVRYGLNVVTAAGNEKDDSCKSSPASSNNVITVAATNANDEMVEFSNHGSCVNVFAPGDRIESAWPGPTNNLINMLSGTSMACPHVSGVVALLLSTDEYANYTPDKILSLIEEKSTKNIVKNIPSWSSTPNRFIYSSPPVQGTEYADNDKINGNDPDNLDDKPDDLNDIIDDDGGKNKPDDGVGDIIDDDDDVNKPDDGVGDIIDDDDDVNRPDDGVGDIIDDDDDVNRPDDGVGDIIDDDDDVNRPNDGVGDIIDDDDEQPDNLDDIIDDSDGNNKGKDGFGEIIDDDDDVNDNPGDFDDIEDSDGNDNNDGDFDDIEDSDGNDNNDGDFDDIEDGDGNDKDDGDFDDIEDGDGNDKNDGDFDDIENSDGNNSDNDLDDIENGGSNGEDNDDLNDIIDDDDDNTADDLNDIIEIDKLYIKWRQNQKNNSIKIKRPFRKDKTYIRYYHFEQLKKKYNLKDY